MDLRQQILDEARRLKLDTDYLWIFQQYRLFCDKVCPLRHFLNKMVELCNEGIFEIAEQIKDIPPSFKLTEKGANLIWGD